MKKRIPFPDNHNRSLSSSLYHVEKLLSKMEEEILEQDDKCCSETIKDIDNAAIAEDLAAIKEARTYRCGMVEKYNTSKKSQLLQRIIDAKRTKI